MIKKKKKKKIRSYSFATLVPCFPLLILGMLRIGFFFAEALIARKLLSQTVNYFQYPFIVICLLSVILYCVFTGLLCENQPNSELLFAGN